MTVSVASLITTNTKAVLLAIGLEVAQALGLETTSWRAGDPTKSLYHFLAEVLESYDGVGAEFVKAGFLSTAEGDWLKVLAWEVYGVDVPDATYATSTVTLTNSGGGVYTIDPGDLVVKSSTSGKTYTNTAQVVFAGPGTATVDVIADGAGSDWSAAADEIDTLVTTYLGVTATASTAAIGADELATETIRQLCRDTTGALSPDGPPDAYRYVATNPTLTGVADVTRVQVLEDSSTGDVVLYVASPTGPVAGASVTAVQTAVETWATPLTITPTVINSTSQTVAVTCSVSGVDTPVTAEDDIESALGVRFAQIGIGGLIARSAIVACIQSTLEAAGATEVTVTLTLPAADVTATDGYVPVLGAVTVTVV